MCVGGTTATSSLGGGGTRLTTAVRDAAHPASPVLRARRDIARQRSHWSSSFITALLLVESFTVMKYFLMP